MEGFTSSLHVKGATAKRVQQAVTDLLSAEGFQVLNAETTVPDEGESLITRGVWIAKTKGDWVSLFCSDFLFQQEIGRELSKQLKTHALNVWVNESSSWHYSLFHNGEEIDQFDSIGDPDELQEFLDNDMDELAEEFDEDDDDELAAEEMAGESDDDDDSPVQAGLMKIAELQEQIADKMPEDVRAIYEKLNEGKASLGEMRRFDQWSQANQAELARFQEQLQEQTAELTATMQGVFQLGLDGNITEASASELLNGALPPDIAELFSKVLSGQANGEELERFAEQMSDDEDEDEDERGDIEFDEALRKLDEDGIEETSFTAAGALDLDSDEDDDDLFSDEDDRSALTEQQLQVHLGALKPLLDKSIDAAAVAETLTTQDDSPEEPLGELLALLGIEGNLATLDFDSFEDLDSEDLAEQGIKLNPLLLVRST